MWNCHFLMILTFTFDVYFTKGLKWKTEPLPVNKCKGQTAHFTWEYIKEPDEEITQLQWIFNRTILIAYSSMNQGFNVEPNYQGRVNQSGETGILLHNISSKDTGNYTLYPLIKWDESPNIQTIRLNVIEPAMEPDCSCTKLSSFPKVRNGQNYAIVIGSCNLEINSSFCCPLGLVNQYCIHDPSKLCTPITICNSVIERDPSENFNQISLICVLVMSSICMFLMFIIICMLLPVRRFLKMNSKKPKERNIDEDCSVLEDIRMQESCTL